LALEQDWKEKIHGKFLQLSKDGEENNALSFCDKRGGRRVDLRTGQATAIERTCPKSDEPNTSCSGLGLDVSVRGPLSEPSDIVDIGAISFPLKGASATARLALNCLRW
jgi:hypothetical protein